MFNEKLALKLLEEDRRDYIKKAINLAQGFLERNMDEAAETTLITAGQELSRLNGSIQYLNQLTDFNGENYPRFGTIFD